MNKFNHPKTKKMFTIDQIKSTHSKVKTGEDYPYYVQEIIRLGVTSYETRVEDGNTIYFGEKNYNAETGPKYETLPINDKSDKEEFKKELKAHQEGKTNYPRFCLDAANSGIKKWVVNMSAMTCTYIDNNGNIMLVETIPVPEIKREGI
jgi:uncharacterized protein YbcV (DUF1398 family)